MTDNLYNKYSVYRNDHRDKPGCDKENARYFVLDYIHDHSARYALAAYAEHCELLMPELAKDIREELLKTGELFQTLLNKKEELK